MIGGPKLVEVRDGAQPSGRGSIAEVLMALTFELAAFTVRQEEEVALVAERAEMIQGLQRALPPRSRRG
jgi:hypothetical protein